MMLMEDYKEFVPKELVLSCFNDWVDNHGFVHSADEDLTYQKIKSLPSVQLDIEPLTDNEQRIFLSAMAREEEVCKLVDESYDGGEEAVNLMKICSEIKRKVKGALFK